MGVHPGLPKIAQPSTLMCSEHGRSRMWLDVLLMQHHTQTEKCVFRSTLLYSCSIHVVGSIYGAATLQRYGVPPQQYGAIDELGKRRLLSEES